MQILLDLEVNMIAQFGTPEFAQTSFGGGNAKVNSALIGKLISVIGDGASHPGALTTSNQDGKTVLGGIAICVDQCLFACTIPGHGTTAVTAITKKSKINGKLIVGYGAVAACGAIMTPPNRKATAE